MDDATCVYDHEINGGCAIGCDIRPSLAKELGSEGLEYIFNKLPKRLQNMGGEFLAEVQRIHDNEYNWLNERKNGMWWNEDGKKRINSLIDDYSLDLEHID